MDIIISSNTNKPIYEQISTQIKAMIMNGELKAGDAIPPMRAMAKSLRVSVITVQHAYEDLQREGFIETIIGRGPITEEDIVKIATSICGLFKDVEERVYRVYLNKSDILREKEPAEHIVEELERKNTVAAYGSLLEE